MPLPKLPTKPAALLSPSDYPKAEKGKTVKPAIALVETMPPKPEPAPILRAKAPERAPAEKPRATKPRAVEPHIKTGGTRRSTDKSGATKLFVLDTNVLM